MMALIARIGMRISDNIDTMTNSDSNDNNDAVTKLTGITIIQCFE